MKERVMAGRYLAQLFSRSGVAWATFGSTPGISFGLERAPKDIDIIASSAAQSVLEDSNFSKKENGWYQLGPVEVWLSPLKLWKTGLLFDFDQKAQSRVQYICSQGLFLPALCFSDWIALKLLLFRNTAEKPDLQDAQAAYCRFSQELDYNYTLERLSQSGLSITECRSRLSLILDKPSSHFLRENYVGETQ